MSLAVKAISEINVPPDPRYEPFGPWPDDPEPSSTPVPDNDDAKEPKPEPQPEPEKK